MRCCSLLGVVFAITGLVTTQANSQIPGDKEAAVAAARDRQEKIKSADIRFKVTKVLAKGSIHSLPGAPQPAQPVPPKETTLSYSNRLVLDGIKSRIELAPPLWDPKHGRFAGNSYVSVFNGTGPSKMYNPPWEGTTNPPSGLIRREPLNPFTKMKEFVALTLAFRGVDPQISPYSLTEVRPTGQAFPVHGDVCREFGFTFPNGLDLTFWLAPEKGWVVRRLRKEKEGRLTSQLDIHYVQNEGWGWVPDSWVHVTYPPTGVEPESTEQGKVTEMTLNGSPEGELFDIRFPPDTLVYDERDRKDYRIQSDGRMRELDRPGGNELANVVPQPGTPWYQRHQWLLLAAGVVTLGFVVWLVLRFRRKGSSPTQVA